MIIEKEKTLQTTMFQFVLPGEVFCTEDGGGNQMVEYFMKFSENVYDEDGADYGGKGFNAVDLANGVPTFFYDYEKCIVKHTAKIIFTEN